MRTNQYKIAMVSAQIKIRAKTHLSKETNILALIEKDTFFQSFIFTLLSNVLFHKKILCLVLFEKYFFCFKDLQKWWE